MKTNPPPILEFDPSPQAILNPAKCVHDLPSKGVLCFFRDVLDELLGQGLLTEIGALRSEIGKNPVYTLDYQGERLFVAHPGVGASLAAGFLEELIASGAKSLIACGGCGALDASLHVGRPVILTAAIRDEGTSYHYLPPDSQALPHPEAVSALRAAFEDEGLPYLAGTAWTTDAIYRETEARRARRIAQGCLVVEMEAAAFFAVAEFRKVRLGQVVYGGDLVVPEGWDGRRWHTRTDIRTELFWLAASAAKKM